MRFQNEFQPWQPGEIVIDFEKEHENLHPKMINVKHLTKIIGLSLNSGAMGMGKQAEARNRLTQYMHAGCQKVNHDIAVLARGIKDSPF